ncbi:MAG: metallophosphoesterase [Firmicutes bacterium]|nr:metallophosphoesterase [Bacillota bacterium]
MKAKKIPIFLCLLCVMLTAVFLHWQNRTISVSEYTYSHPLLGQDLDGFAIAFVSDLHSDDFDGRLLDKLKALEPDLILLGGDLLDCRHGDPQVALDFAAACTQIAGVYYAPGNHEANTGKDYADFARSLEESGVRVLFNSGAEISKGESRFYLLGVPDQAFHAEAAQDAIARLRKNDLCNVLLAHRPERIDSYAGADLVLSGHAHGGQIRLPFVGGLIAPGQGFFPQYDGGCYRVGDTVLIVSRGLGNSVFPWRIFNLPEIVVVTLSGGGNTQ